MSFLEMTLYWIYSIPNWMFGLLCLSALVGFGLVGMMLTRKFVKRVHREDHSHNRRNIVLRSDAGPRCRRHVE